MEAIFAESKTSCVCAWNGVRADSRRDFSFRVAKAVALNSI